MKGSCPEKSLKWKSQFPFFSKTLSLDIIRPYNLLISENISKCFLWRAKKTTFKAQQLILIHAGVNIHFNVWTKFPLNIPQPPKVLSVNRQNWNKLTVNRQSYHRPHWDPLLNAVLLIRIGECPSFLSSDLQLLKMNPILCLLFTNYDWMMESILNVDISLSPWTKFRSRDYSMETSLGVLFHRTICFSTFYEWIERVVTFFGPDFASDKGRNGIQCSLSRRSKESFSRASLHFSQ